jgi:hypothetical protein
VADLRQFGRPRGSAWSIAALREIVRRMWPEVVYKQRMLFTLINGYVFHVGLALIVPAATHPVFRRPARPQLAAPAE